jgi:Leucine-rich repeat (LRR) protein
MQDSSSHLNLWKKQLGRVPDSVWQQTHLETLVLAENGLSEVSEHIGRLKKLRMLDLGHNTLTSVPDGLADLDLRWVDTLIPQSWIADLEARGCVVYR